jgi:hypothetical protein
MEGDTGQEVENILRPVIVSYWKETIEDDIRANGLLADLYDDGDALEGERRVENAVEENLAEYGLDFDAEDFATIAGCVDVASEIESNRERGGDSEEYRSEGRSGMWSTIDAVDDLFSIDGPMGGPRLK